MSFEIFWEKVSTKESREAAVIFLNKRLGSLVDKPTFIGDISVVDIDFGTAIPEITIVKIEDPYPIFYEEDDENVNPVDSLRSSFLSSSNMYYDEETAMRRAMSTDRIRIDHQRCSLPDIYKTVPDWLENVHNSTATYSPTLKRNFSHSSKGLPCSHSLPHLPMSISGNGCSSMQRHEERTIGEKEIGPNDAASQVGNISVMKGIDSARSANDVQFEFEVNYKGDMSITIRTELILHFPTPNFMSLPIQLRLKGFTFSAPAILAYVGGRMNFCFMERDENYSILENMRIESEVGARDKQVLKNVTKLEKFILEKVRALLYDQLVFPCCQTMDLTAS